jgi:hypothetical protein
MTGTADDARVPDEPVFSTAKLLPEEEDPDWLENDAAL